MTAHDCLVSAAVGCVIAGSPCGAGGCPLAKVAAGVVERMGKGVPRGARYPRSDEPPWGRIHLVLGVSPQGRTGRGRQDILQRGVVWLPWGLIHNDLVSVVHNTKDRATEVGNQLRDVALGDLGAARP